MNILDSTNVDLYMYIYVYMTDGMATSSAEAADTNSKYSTQPWYQP